MIPSDNLPRDPYWNGELEAWLETSAILGAIHGVMLLGSFFGMSEVAGSVAAAYMEFIYSNVYIPAYFYCGYQIW